MKFDKIINWTFFLAFIMLFFISFGVGIFAVVQTEYIVAVINLSFALAVMFPMVLITYQDAKS